MRDLLDAGLKRIAPLAVPFYIRHPYRGPLWLTEVDTRGAISVADGFFFNRVPKAANSTIIDALARSSAARSGQDTGRRDAKWYFQRPLFASRATVRRLEREFFRFTFVRSPYSRTLSAFLDKIVGRTQQSKPFYRWWDGSGAPSFGDFCRYLEAGGLHHDIHWAPQSDILLLQPEEFHLIGRFERLQEDLAQVLQRVFGADAVDVGRAGPRSDAGGAMTTHYDDDTLAAVSRLFAKDCERFGYARPWPDDAVG